MFSWESFREQLREKQGINPAFKSLLDSIKFNSSFLKENKETLSFSVPSVLHQKQAQKHLIPELKQKVKDYKILFEIDPSLKTPEIDSKELLNLSSLYKGSQKKQHYTAKSQQKLNPIYTFENFIKGPENCFALEVCQSLSTYPSNLQSEKSINPLFIYGPSGLGKTHLLCAFGHKIQASFPELKLLYTSGEGFLNQCISAFRHKKMQAFKEKFRDSCDILLVDDIQIIGKGSAVQDEFFYTLNTFLENSKQVVIASDRMPKELGGIEDRIKTRFEWGVIADIQVPCIETRIAILKSKIARKNLLVPEDVIEYIASISKKSVRELEGNLNKLKMFSELRGIGFSMDLAQKILACHEDTKTLTIDEIQKHVCQHYKIRFQDIKSKSRKKEILLPRQVAMSLAKDILNTSLTNVGRAFGGRDHSTVLNALKKVDTLRQKNSNFDREIKSLTARIKGYFNV